MFPWVDGFHWTMGHIVFLSLFFAAVLVIGSTLVSALLWTASDFRSRRAAELCWRINFRELPEAERHCRHEFAGRAPSRVCDNAFDCRSCQNYAKYAALPGKDFSRNRGVHYSVNLLYHRGHTWVRPRGDGTCTIGLDEFASRLIGKPDTVDLPAKNTELVSDGVAWRMTKNGREIRVRAPLDGTVLSTGGPEHEWFLKIRPHEPLNLRHLLSGAEVSGWLAAELDRLQLQLSAPNSAPCLADGGTLMPDLMDAVPQADWDAVLAATFLES